MSCAKPANCGIFCAFARQVGKVAKVGAVMKATRMKLTDASHLRGSERSLGEPARRTIIASAPVGVLIVSENRLYVESLIELLGHDESLSIIGSTEGLDEARKIIRGTKPDVVLVDVCEPDASKIIRALAEENATSNILALGVGEADCDVLRFAEAGALGYVSRRASLDDAIGAIKSAALGEAVFGPRKTATLVRRLSALASNQTFEHDQPHLTKREVEVLELLSRGLSNKEIARSLSLEVATVKNHVHNILQKLDLHRRAQATAWLQSRAARKQPPGHSG